MVATRAKCDASQEVRGRLVMAGREKGSNGSSARELNTSSEGEGRGEGEGGKGQGGDGTVALQQLGLAKRVPWSLPRLAAKTKIA
jgi:hypothetical protein